MRLLLQLRGAAPPRAVHDSVARIIQQRPYQRSLRTSLLERFWRWVNDLLDRIADAMPHVPHARQVAIACIVVLLVLVVLRVVLVTRLGDDDGDAVLGPRRGGASDANPLERARLLAAEGSYTDAAHALYRALVLVLVRRERLRMHSSKTSGDYARELRARGSPLYQPFRLFGRRYDRLLFGKSELDAAGYDALLHEAMAIIGAERAA
ncbi:MAG: hypothetical protein JWO05_3025 [Gemmatimonadetes bacterium]|nr:hypothetical protein [Gemmatimonadota bacterium]